MFMGALLDVGLDYAHLTSELQKLNVEGITCMFPGANAPKSKGQNLTFISGTIAHGHDHDHDHKHEHGHEHEHGHNYAEIKQLILKSGISEWAKAKSHRGF